MITRRDFLARGGALVFAASPFARFPYRALALAPLRLVYVDDGAPDARDGFTLGVEEARHAAALFGGAVESTTVGSPSALAPALRAARCAAVVGGRTADAVRSLAATARAAGAIHLNVFVADDELRAACDPGVFHVAPSEAMLRDARVLAHAPDAGIATAWDPSLRKFGADTLNDRFAARFGRPMTHDAWTSWFAVKALWESSLRARSVDATAIMRFLATDAAQFDGHKGRPLSFRQWNHQLRQPVYVRVAPDRPFVEEPTQGEDEDARASLDRIGVDAQHATCSPARGAKEL